MELVLVERRFDEPANLEDISKLMRDNSWCSETYKIRFVKTLFSRDRRRMLCLFEAPDTESVRLAEEKSRVSYERALALARQEPERRFLEKRLQELG